MTPPNQQRLKILVTGGNGFIGYHLAKQLCELGHAVTICDVKPLSKKEPLFATYELLDVASYIQTTSFAEGFETIYGKQEQFDFIFHLAAIPRVGISMEYPEIVLKNNIESTIEVLGYCRKHPQTKLIFISSSSVVWADINTNPYALSKQIGEQLLSTYSATFGVECASVRLFSVYGPGEAYYEYATTIVKQCKHLLTSGLPLLVHGTGKQVRDFTHVSDAVSGLVAIMNEMSNGEWKPVYELGTGDNSVSVEDVVTAFSTESNQVIRVSGRSNDPVSTLADLTLAPKGWKSKIKILDYIAAWKRNGSLND